MDLTVEKIEDLLNRNHMLFLSGNGLSVNFDDGFYNIYDNLFNAHKDLIYNMTYEIKAGRNFKKKFLDNYNELKQYVRFFKKKDIESIFIDAVDFANSIISNSKVINKIKKSGILIDLTFGMNELDILEQVSIIGNKKGFKYINIEYWTILVYFYYLLKNLEIEDMYVFPENNMFLTLLKVGSISNLKLIDSTDLKTELMAETISNGFSTYYRLLFISATFNNGKALDFDSLEKLDLLNLDKINKFLSKFESLATLNYDNILKSVTGRDISYLHGRFIPNSKSYVYHQSIKLLKNDINIDCSDIIIGDYFTYKTMLPVVNKLSASKYNNIDNFNKEVPYCKDLLQEEFSGEKINSILLFGIDVTNDYHILRNIMIELFFAYQKGYIDNPKIIYSYYSTESKEVFKEMYQKVITFSDELNSFVKDDIEVFFISTKEILESYFYK